MLLAIVKGADHIFSVLLLLPLAILDQTCKWLEGLRRALLLLLGWLGLVCLSGWVPTAGRCDSTGGRRWELGDLGGRSGLG